AGGTLLFHQLFNRLTQFVYTFYIPFLDILHHTGMNMFRKECFIKSIQRCLNGLNLNKNINTVPVLFQHLFNSTHLSLYSAQAVDQIPVFFSFPVFFLLFFHPVSSASFHSACFFLRISPAIIP